MKSNEISKDQTIACDLCGEKKNSEEIHKTDNLVYLCSNCLIQLQTAPEKIKESIEEFLIKNVL